MRWDRSGVLVTTAFDYEASPQTLIEFVWRFVRAGKVQQGFDPTVTLIDSDEDRGSFLEAIRSHVQLQLALDPGTKELDKAVNEHYSGGLHVCLSATGTSGFLSHCWCPTPLLDLVLQDIGVYGVTLRSFM